MLNLCLCRVQQFSSRPRRPFGAGGAVFHPTRSRSILMPLYSSGYKLQPAAVAASVDKTVQKAVFESTTYSGDRRYTSPRASAAVKANTAISFENAPGCKQFRKPVFSATGTVGFHGRDMYRWKHLVEVGPKSMLSLVANMCPLDLHSGAFSREIRVLRLHNQLAGSEAPPRALSTLTPLRNTPCTKRVVVRPIITRSPDDVRVA